MQPPRFLIGQLPTGEQRWASIDAVAHHVEGAIAERRFSAFCRPFPDEQEARQALIEAGCDLDSIESEQRSGRRRGRR